MTKVSVDGLSNALKKVMEEYEEEANQVLKETVEKVAKSAKKDLKSSSPKKTGKYASGWSCRVTENRLGHVEGVVYNGSKPGLTHLLENGHATKNGTGRLYSSTPAHPHIAAVNEKAQEDFVNQLPKKLEGIGGSA